VTTEAEALDKWLQQQIRITKMALAKAEQEGNARDAWFNRGRKEALQEVRIQLRESK